MSDGWMRDVVAGLGDEDRRRLLAPLEEAIRGEMPPGPAEPGDDRPPECPRCGCGRVVGHGTRRAWAEALAVPRLRQVVRRLDGQGARGDQARGRRLAGVRLGDARRRHPQELRPQGRRLSQDELLHEAPALRGHGPHGAGTPRAQGLPRAAGRAARARLAGRWAGWRGGDVALSPCPRAERR
jgi:hypothetical protein